MSRVVSAAVLFMLLTSTILLAFCVHCGGASESIYIRADGSISPPTANIASADNVTYTFTDINYDPIVIEKGDIVVDGAGYTLQGSGRGDGFYWSSTNNVTIKNTQIAGFDTAIRLRYSSNNTISGNNITTNNYYGIDLFSSSNNDVRRNSIWENNYYGIRMEGSSSSNLIQWNNITGYHLVGICMYEFSCFNTIRGNNIEKNVFGISLSGSSNNTMQENNIERNLNGTYLYTSSDNIIHHNNFIDNIQQVCSVDSTDAWDNGYPSGGNYWNDYVGVDLYRGAHQDEAGSDGMGDTPYDVGIEIVDHCPLMGPFGSLTFEGEHSTVFPSSDVGVIFENVTFEGYTIAGKTDDGPGPPSGFKLAEQYYDIQTTANHTGKTTIRIVYDDANMIPMEEEALQLLHWNETSQEWTDTTTHVDTVNNVIYGEATSLSVFAIIAPLVHNVAITAVVPSKTVIGQSFSMSIKVTIKNRDYIDTSNVTIYVNDTLVELQAIVLTNGTSTTLTFTWDTAGFAYGNYTVYAYAEPVSGETHTADNTFVFGSVMVSIPGDVNGDRAVDIFDIVRIAAVYGKPLWGLYMNCDIEGDCDVDIFDIVKAAGNYGEGW